jgi:hypothetical protein
MDVSNTLHAPAALTLEKQPSRSNYETGGGRQKCRCPCSGRVSTELSHFILQIFNYISVYVLSLRVCSQHGTPANGSVRRLDSILISGVSG